MLVPISSTKTNRLGSTFPETISLQASLKNSSRSTAPTLRFLAEAESLEKPPDGGVTQCLAGELLSRKRRLSETVAAGRFFTSSSSSF